MKRSTIVLLLLSVLFVQSLAFDCYIEDDHIPEVVTTPLDVADEAELPKEWLWNNVNGTNYLTLIRNQHIPQYCGSCWAFASTSALSDRIKIARKAQWPDYEIAPQVLLSCAQQSKGCRGGGSITAYQYIHLYGITHESCSNYQARGWNNGLQCTDEIKCLTCRGHHGGCNVPEEYPIFKVSQYGRVKGELDMMNEIYQRGPISCGVFADPIVNYTGGIFNDTTGGTKLDHVVSVVGWGEENGVKYWLIRNSWGTYWGEEGYFRLIRGINNLGIETACSWAVPKDTWTNNVKNHSKKAEPKNETIEPIVKLSSYLRSPNPNLEFKTEDVEGCVTEDYVNHPPLSSLSGKLPGSEIPLTDIPKSYDWRNVNGRNYLSWTKNQHIPVYCGSCWAQAATSTLADAINIKRGGTHNTVALSVQAVLNCRYGGSCHGGSPLKVFKHAHEQGLVEESCQIYESRDPVKAECSPIQVCKNCVGPAPKEGDDGQAKCWAVTDYKKWKVSDYGTVSGQDKMKQAIIANGPLACGIYSTHEFHNYTGGIYSQVVKKLVINHIISIVGWGVENGTEYWIGRNSWGSYWGEQGFFRIKMGHGSLGVEKHCSWATPIIDDSKQDISKDGEDLVILNSI